MIKIDILENQVKPVYLSIGSNLGNKKKNIDILQEIFKYYNENQIKLIHIRSHTGLQDEHSIGNDHADRLANLAIGVESCPYSNSKQKQKQKIYLNVPYSEKNEAKKLGAKWDGKKKKWFIDNNNKNKIQMMGHWGN